MSWVISAGVGARGSTRIGKSILDIKGSIYYYIFAVLVFNLIISSYSSQSVELARMTVVR